jgi:hypothetical protein
MPPLNEDSLALLPTWTLFLVRKGSPRELIRAHESLRDSVRSIAQIEGLRAEKLLLQTRVDLSSEGTKPTRLEYQGRTALYVIELAE